MRRAARSASSSLEVISSSGHVNVILLLLVFVLHTPRRPRYCYFTRLPYVCCTIWISNLHQDHLVFQIESFLFYLFEKERANQRTFCSRL